MSRWSGLIVCAVMFFSAATPVFAENPSTGVCRWLQEAGVSLGYARGDLKRNDDDMISVPLSLRLGFDLKPWTEKFGFSPKGYLELVYEPFLGPVATPDANIELGMPVSFKYAFPLFEKFYPYVSVGIGPYYTSLHTYEQSTQFNFVSQGGAGFMFFIEDHWALTCDYRRRHVSNAGIEKPNAGIDANVYTVGLSYYF